MPAERPAFEEAIASFRAFLRKEGRSDRLLWVTRDRVAGHRSTVWIFRPRESISDARHREFYEAIRKKKTSIRIDILCELPDGVVAYVQDYGGDGGHLNYGIALSKRRISIVSFRLHWWMVSAYCRLLGESPFLRDIQIPKEA